MLQPHFVINSSGSAAILDPPPQPNEPKTKQKFDAEFIERRMREHRDAQEKLANELEYDIIREVLLDAESRQ